jgi:UPF0755 protein
MKRNSINRSRLSLKVIAAIIISATILSVIVAYYKVWRPHALWNSPESKRILFINSDTGWNELKSSIDTVLPNVSTLLFDIVGERMNLNRHIYPGRYELKKKLSLIALIRQLRSGEQSPVSVTIPEIESIQLALIRGTRNLEIDSIRIARYLEQDTIWKQRPYWIIPNTYEMYWNVTPEEYMNRLYREGKSFWNQSQQKKRLREINLEAREAYILASIVDRETNFSEEMDRIAGVYYNRLEINMPLQADPTIKYLLPEGVNRVLFKDLEIDSPYNTYKNTGLPPGPVGLAGMKSIQAVLALEDHDFLYFCANPEKPGTHSFSRSYSEHLRNARKYHRSLN